MKRVIWFDMDGTIADLYGVENWLDMLCAADATPYKVAKPLVNLSQLARKLNQLRRAGYQIGIISWLAKNATPEYSENITAAKLGWLKKHLTSVHFDAINIVNYGVNKWEVCGAGILFDDEERNRNAWQDEAYGPEMIIAILNKLMKRS